MLKVAIKKITMLHAETFGVDGYAQHLECIYGFMDVCYIKIYQAVYFKYMHFNIYQFYLHKAI